MYYKMWKAFLFTFCCRYPLMWLSVVIYSVLDLFMNFFLAFREIVVALVSHFASSKS